MMDFVFKMMNPALKLMNFALKMDDFVKAAYAHRSALVDQQPGGGRCTWSEKSWILMLKNHRFLLKNDAFWIKTQVFLTQPGSKVALHNGSSTYPMYHVVLNFQQKIR